MEEKELKWYIADKEYVNYLREFDSKVENINYSNKLKPYIGILITINEFNYYVPISSAKEKHYRIKEGMDLIKIKQNDKIIGVLNLNNMIPISDNNVKELQYKDIGQYRDFTNDREKSLYISFLSLELDLINKKMEKIKKNAIKLYMKRTDNPTSNVSKRCCNFKLLEEKSKLYNNSFSVKDIHKIREKHYEETKKTTMK